MGSSRDRVGRRQGGDYGKMETMMNIKTVGWWETPLSQVDPGDALGGVAQIYLMSLNIPPWLFTRVPP